MFDSKDSVLYKDELSKYLVEDYQELLEFINQRFYKIIVFVEKISDLYKKNDNIIEDINLLFDNNDNNNIKISTIPFSQLQDMMEIELNSEDQKVIEIEKFEITNIISLNDFEKLLSLQELSSMVIQDNKTIENLFSSGKNSLLLLTDDLENLSELLPEPRKNVNQLYEKFYNVDTSDYDLKVLYSSAEDLNNLLYSNDVDELPLPLLFKVDNTGTLSFPIHIKRENNSEENDYKNVNYIEEMEKFDDFLENLS